MQSRLSLISLCLIASLVLTACGRVGALEPPPGKEAQTTPLPKVPAQPAPLLRPVAEPLMPLPRIAPRYPTGENAPTQPRKPTRKFFLDPLL